MGGADGAATGDGVRPRPRLLDRRAAHLARAVVVLTDLAACSFIIIMSSHRDLLGLLFAEDAHAAAARAAVEQRTEGARHAAERKHPPAIYGRLKSPYVRKAACI